MRRVSSDLVVWLRAQLDEDERLARAAMASVSAEPDASGEWPGWPWPSGGTSKIPWVVHCMAHDPARVLVEVDSKRKILDLHSVGRSHRDDGKPVCGSCRKHRLYPCQVVLLLALPYAGRPGYLKEWAP